MVIADKTIVFVLLLQGLQVFGDCQVKRVVRSQPNAPNIIKFSIECVNPTDDDDPIVAASSDVNDVVEPLQEKSKPQLSKLSSLFKNYLKDPIEQASSRAASEKPELPSKLTFPKLQSLLKKSPEEPIAQATIDEIFPKTKFSKLKLPSPELKTFNSEPRFASLDKAPSFEDPVKLFKSQLPKFPSLVKKSAEEAGDSAAPNLEKLDEVLKNSKLRLPKLMSLLKKQSDDPIVSGASNVASVEEPPKPSKLKLTLPKVSSPVKKTPEDLIDSARSNLAAVDKKLKLPSLPKLQLPKSLTAPKKSFNEPIVSSSVPEVKEISKISKLPALFKKSLEKPVEVVKDEEQTKISKLPKLQLPDLVSRMRSQAKAVGETSHSHSDQTALPGKIIDFISKVRSHVVKPVDELAGSATNLVLQVIPDSVKSKGIMPQSDTLESSSSEIIIVEETGPARSEEKPTDEEIKLSSSEESSDADSTKVGKQSLLTKPQLLKAPLKLDKDFLHSKSPLFNKAKKEMRNLETKPPSEHLPNLLDKLRNTLNEAVTDGKMDPLKGKKLLSKLSKDLDRQASNPLAPKTEPDDNIADASEKSVSDSKPAIGRSRDEDDFIGLTQKELDSKSCDLCKCFMKVFPQKFQDGNVAASEYNQRMAAPPQRKLPILPSRISNKMRDIFQPKDDDLSVMADNEHPSIALPPDGNAEVERAERVREGIERLIHFVELVGEMDQYISHKTMKFINRMARLYDGEESPQLL